MKQHNGYIAKEAFTFPLFCLVCMAFNVYWGCTDGWHAGAIIGTSFSAIITMCYVVKYSRFGRNCLKIDANGIEIKDWSKITMLKWSDIKKCEVYYKSSYASAILFARDLFIVAQSDNKREQHIFVSLSGKYCRNKSVIEAIERFGGNDVFDSQSSRSQSTGDTFQGPLSRQQKDSIVAERKMNPDKMKHSSYE